MHRKFTKMANINFTSDSFKNFKFFHEELNTYVKLSISAIDHLSDKTREEKDLSTLIQKLILDSGERWTPTKYENPFNELAKLRTQLTKSAIMWVFSSFEVFLNHVHSSCEIANSNESEIRERESTKESIRLKELFIKYKWKLDDLNYLLPAFEFYSLSRHCITHNMGKATKELKEISEDEGFINSVNAWPTVIDGRNLSPHPVINDSNIEFNPHHAITYSDICFRIAKYINGHMLDLLGIEFYVLKTTKKHLLEINQLASPTCTNLYAYINYHLKNDYGIDKLETVLIKSILTKKDWLEKSRIKYSKLKREIN
jgi:hypothetical protein